MKSSMLATNEFVAEFFENQIWMTSADAARYLRKSTDAIRVMVYRKQIPFRKLGRRLYFKRSELDALMDSLLTK